MPRDVAARRAELGCVFAQGYRFAHPMPADAPDDWLAALTPRPATPVHS